MNLKLRNTCLLSFVLTVCLSSLTGFASGVEKLTFCNPMDLSYRFQVSEPSRREAADPTVVWFRDRYYLFASMSSGYWHSKDLVNWEFIETHEIPTEEYAPCAIGIGDTLYFLASSNEKSTVYQSTDPLSGRWSVAVDELETPVWDPSFFMDDDDRLYLYWGCSDKNPIYGVEVDLEHGFAFKSKPVELFHSHPEQYGWEVPGDYNTLIDQAPWIEGPWVNKKDGVYYLQYAGPGTEYKSYTDGVYTATSPLGPYHYQPHNPFSYKPEGFAAGAGHGCTFQDQHGNYWHIATVTISQKHMFERRLALYPTFIDETGTMHTDTRFGDYPMWMPQESAESAASVQTGWMLLSYGKPVTASSSLENHPVSFINDEDIRTYWAAESGDAGESVEMDLGDVFDVYALQLNFAEHKTELLGRVKGICHQYVVEVSKDGKNWNMLLDRSENMTDNTHAYVELPKQTQFRYIRVQNVKVPDGNFAMSGLRVFGCGHAKKPERVSSLEVVRNAADPRSVNLSWDASENAIGYVIRFGISEETLYHSYKVYHTESVAIHSLDAAMPYVFTIDAFNENGVTESGVLIHD